MTDSEVPRERSSAGGKIAGVWLALIVGLGALLRSYRLGSWDLWTDEVQTLRMVTSEEFWFGPMYSTAPLNFWLTGWTVDLFGANELGLRLAPMLAGVLTLVAFYFLMRRWMSSRAALFGTALVAFSFWHVAWSQTGRHFALQTLLLLGALHGFLLFWKEGKRVGLGLAGVLSLAALFTHSSSGFYVAGLLLVVGGSGVLETREGRSLREIWENLRPRVLPAALVLVGVLLVYAPIYLSVGAYILETREAWNPPWNILGSLGFYLSPFLLGVAAAGGGLAWARDRELVATLAAFVVVPVVLLTAASAVTIASAAYCLPSLIGIAALAGIGCDRLLEVVGRRSGGLLAAGAIVAALFVAQGENLLRYFVYYNGVKPRWAEAASYVSERRGPGERVWASEGDVAQFYLGRSGVEWLAEYGKVSRPPGSDRSGPGAWFIVYLEKAPRLTGLPAVEVPPPGIPPEATVEAIFPLHYGPKDRTLVVYHSTPSRSGERVKSASAGSEERQP